MRVTLEGPSDSLASIVKAADHVVLSFLLTVLKQYGDRITLYFAAGASDGWVGDETRVAKITTALDSSKSLTNDTRERWHICRKGMPHAFCLEHSNSMAHLCAEWVADELSRTRS